MLGSKFAKFLSFLKQKLNFSSNFAPLFDIMRHISSILFLAEILYTFSKSNLSKYKFGEMSPEQSKVWNLGSFCKNHIKFQLKKVQMAYLQWQWRVMQSFKKNWLVVWNMIWEIWWILTQPLKSQMFLSKVYKVWAKTNTGSYLSWHWTLMQNLNKTWPCGSKNGMRN